jgi:hypothetical protein
VTEWRPLRRIEPYWETWRLAVTHNRLLARSQVCAPDITRQGDGPAHDFDSGDRGFNRCGAANAAKSILLRNYSVLTGIAESDGRRWRVQLVQHARGQSSGV